MIEVTYLIYMSFIQFKNIFIYFSQYIETLFGHSSGEKNVKPKLKRDDLWSL